MRISTLTIFERSVSSMNRQQADFIKTGQQIASGKRVVNPSDDPRAASQAIGLSQSIGVLEQYTDARVLARNALGQGDSVLSSIGDGVASGRTLLIQGINGTLSNADRISVATELEGVLESLLGQANATDGNGTYLYGGFEDSSAPFVRDAAGNVNYVGDDNQLHLRLDSSRLMPVTDTGEDVFMKIQQGSGYIAVADTSNTGTAIFKGPLITNPDDPQYGNAFDVAFSDNAGQLQVSVGGGVPQDYNEGDSVNFGGLTLELSGLPEAGDSFTVDRAENLNTNMFDSLRKAIDALKSPQESGTEQAAFMNTMNTVIRELDNSLDNVLSVRASVGSRLNELDVIDNVADNRMLNYKTNLSGLVDLDYNTAISEYSLRQVGLQAAQKSFVDISGLSLFNYLN